MWKSFCKDGEVYMIKTRLDENFEVYFSNFKEIWIKDTPKQSILEKFQELNPVFDIKLEDALTHVLDLLNGINEESVSLEFADETVLLSLQTTVSNFPVKFEFNLPKGTSDIFFKEVTIPLVQTVKTSGDQQKMLCKLLAKKDRELEEYQLEKGIISRTDLVTEKFDEATISCDDKSMINSFVSKEVWETFSEKYGGLTTVVEDVKIEPWNHVKRKRRIYSSKTIIKKGKGIDYSK